MVTLNFSAGAVFVAGLALGVIFGVIGLCIVAYGMSKKNKGE